MSQIEQTLPDRRSIGIMRSALLLTREYCLAAAEQRSINGTAQDIEQTLSGLSLQEQYAFYANLTSIAYHVEYEEVDANMIAVCGDNLAEKLNHVKEGLMEILGEDCAERPKKAARLVHVFERALDQLDALPQKITITEQKKKSASESVKALIKSFVRT